MAIAGLSGEAVPGWGPFFGVLCFALLFVAMTTMGVQEPGKLIVQGLIILLAAIFYGVRSKSKVGSAINSQYNR